MDRCLVHEVHRCNDDDSDDSGHQHKISPIQPCISNGETWLNNVENDGHSKKDCNIFHCEDKFTESCKTGMHDVYHEFIFTFYLMFSFLGEMRKYSP
jgi:hypothetical protein